MDALEKQVTVVAQNSWKEGCVVITTGNSKVHTGGIFFFFFWQNIFLVSQPM